MAKKARRVKAKYKGNPVGTVSEFDKKFDQMGHQIFQRNYEEAVAIGRQLLMAHPLCLEYPNPSETRN